MGKELEYKLSVPNEEILKKILLDEEIAALISDTWSETKMKTTYYDTAERRFSANRFTLRQRYEGEESIVCLKTPMKESHARGEWQIKAEKIDDAAIAQLLQLGAPMELVAFYASGPILPVCGAEFLRRHVMLTFPDGSQAEIAGDCGFLHGQSETLAFIELELELYKGESSQMLTLVQHLCDKYDLHEQPMSKYARARTLK